MHKPIANCFVISVFFHAIADNSDSPDCEDVIIVEIHLLWTKVLVLLVFNIRYVTVYFESRTYDME